MKKYFIPAVAAAILLPMAFSSCETPVGQGAGFGAATGAIIGGAATGRVRGAAIGAGIGALSGALIGAAIEEDQARYYHAPPGGYPFAQPTGTPVVEIATLLAIIFFVLVAALIVAVVRAVTGRRAQPSP